jgi:hypothetical protein
MSDWSWEGRRQYLVSTGKRGSKSDVHSGIVCQACFAVHRDEASGELMCAWDTAKGNEYFLHTEQKLVLIFLMNRGKAEEVSRY